ncbi:hypothetical protein [Nostoc sp.]|uniref:hypothetical protein n=1 Tax=Nostoc sp. TaxID=1180 RepID=UPI002FF5B2FB
MIAVSIDLTVDDATTDAAINRFKTQAVDGYDLAATRLLDGAFDRGRLKHFIP